jgi:uncharacterized protein YodC (DUF2158 family)
MKENVPQFIGDKVKLKPGGPEMVVTGLWKDSGAPEMTVIGRWKDDETILCCEWMHTDGKPERAYFNADMLTLLERV